MNTYIVIGAPGAGKSPFIRSLIKGRRCLIFDVANEYGQRVKYAGQEPVNLPTKTTFPRSRYIGGKMKDFVSLVKQKTNTVCVFEEATAFLQGMLHLEVTSLIVNRLHTGNSYVFVFHSINSVPPRLLEMCSYVVLFRTNDLVLNVERKAPQLLKYFLELKKKKFGEKFIIKIM